MLALFLFFILVAVALGLVGALTQGLFYLLIIGSLSSWPTSYSWAQVGPGGHIDMSSGEGVTPDSTASLETPQR